MPLLVMTGPLPGGPPRPRRNAACPCGRGKLFKKCCGSSNSPSRPGGAQRLLVVGAGAAVEECLQSGVNRDHPFPIIRNFASRLFHESAPLQRVIADYLSVRGVAFDDAIVPPLSEGESRQLTPEQMENSPLRVFQRLEAADPASHNVERLFEFVWQTHGDDGELWEALAWDGVLTNLYNECITQFPGFGPAHSMHALLAGQAVGRCLVPGDRVVNLNYDTLFDLALQQAGRFSIYAPEPPARGAILIYKPHGSFNLYAHRSTGDAFFADPSQMRGSVALQDSSGRVWSPAAAIVPPRFGKTYGQHPSAAKILSGLATFKPEIVTFWGIGLTSSDIDLLALYRTACENAPHIEFVNPDVNAFEHTRRLIGRSMQHFERLTDWLPSSTVDS